MMRAFCFAALALLASSGCSDGAVTYAAYDGPPAYPNQRTSYAGAAERLGYVSNSLSDTISLLDLDRLSLIAELPVGRDPVDVDGPHHLAIDAARRRLYVALSYPAPSTAPGPHVGHGASNRYGYVQALDLDDLRPLGEVRVEQNPGDIVLAPDGASLAVTHYDLVRAQRETTLEAQRALLLLLDPTPTDGAPDLRRAIQLCIAPHGVTYSHDSARLFVTCTGEDSIAVVEAASGQVVARVPVATRIGTPGAPLHEPYAAVLDPAGKRLAVANLGSATLVLFDVGEALSRSSSTPLLGAPYFAAWTHDGGRLIVPTQGPDGAVLVDGQTGALLAEARYSAEVCGRPHEAVTDDTGRVFIVCEGDHVSPGSVVEVDAQSLQVLARVEVGRYPDRLRFLSP